MLSPEDQTKLCELGLAVIETELAAIHRLKSQINRNFVQACDYLLNCKGRVVVMGMGKSGHIGSKIAATFASTGTPAFFVHPGEASHGDLGMITQNDVVIAISFSGETAEIITLLPLIKRFNVPLIAITGKPNSTLAKTANTFLEVSIEKEACPFNLAPTSSTTATLVMGDALAIALLEARGFTKEDFARAHPGGSLGKRLLLHVEDILHTGSDIPAVQDTATVSDALLEMTSKRLGMTAVVNNHNRIIGIFTDGDLRRALDKNVDIKKTPIQEVMTRQFTHLQPNTLAVEALRLMQEKKINGFFVINPDETIKGAFNIHDLLRAGVV